jgi:hypothetical protein
MGTFSSSSDYEPIALSRRYLVTEAVFFLLSVFNLNLGKRGNTYSAYDLEASAVCEAVKHWRCYLEGCSKFRVVTYHDILRHMLKQPKNRMNKRQARYLRNLQPFEGSMTLAYRKGA